MKRAISRVYSSLQSHRAVILSCTLILAGAATPRAAWGQWTTGSSGAIYYNGGHVGIGTTTPSWALDVVGGYSRLGLMSILTADTGHEWWTGSFTDSSSWQLTRTTTSSGAWSNFLTVLTSGNVGIGTSNPQHLLHVAGTIGAEEVLVTSSGADYVFEPGYRLRPLSEVADFIQAHHHLPDIPSEAEVKEKGMGVGEMEAKLLAKVEELTLHMIQQEKENRELRQRIAQLEKKNVTRQTAAK